MLFLYIYISDGPDIRIIIEIQSKLKGLTL